MKATSLKQALTKTKVPSGAIGLAWLGQAGFVLKSPQGKLLALDPYLSNSCKALGQTAGFNMDRLVPVQLQPAELAGFDAIVLTHSHQDHLDPDTIKPLLRTGHTPPILAPFEAARELARLGVPESHILPVCPNRVRRVGDFTLRTTFAIPFGPDDLNHVGYLIEVQNGPRIYFTGDTDYNEILSLQSAPYQPDILVAVINPAFRNLSPAHAATLARDIKPRWVIPCHHDLFPDNSLPANLLKTNLTILGLTEKFCPLQHGQLKIFREKKKRQPLAGPND